MGEALRVILLVCLAAAALTTGALTLNWWMEPERRLRRAIDLEGPAGVSRTLHRRSIARTRRR